MEIKVGNETKQIQNNLFVKSCVYIIDPGYMYGEIFGKFPIYKYCVEINRTNDDDSYDIYNVIYNDLIKTGDFETILYEYNKQGHRGMPSITDENNNLEKTCVEKFVVVLKNEPVMVYYEYEYLYIITHIDVEKINGVFNKYLKSYNQKDDSVKCYVMVKEPDFCLDSFDVKLKGDLDLDLYNDGFSDIHNDIVKSIINDDNGLYLFYGKPGTGKSTYIRHLIKVCGTDKRKFVYVPSSLFGDFTNPGILPFLLRNRGCIFIIEDCESLVTVDDGVRSEGITDLLNITDGLLADALNVKIICTFNTDYDKIDDALLRPGRCRCKYEFDLLNKDRANVVAEKFGLETVNKDVSLAELFNPDIEFAECKKKKKLGFQGD